MVGKGSVLVLLLVLLLLSVCCKTGNAQAAIAFNTTARCAIVSVCDFNDRDTWIGNVVPTSESSVVINSSIPVTIRIASNVSVGQIALHGSVELLISLSLIVNGNITYSPSSNATITMLGDGNHYLGALSADNVDIASISMTGFSSLECNGSLTAVNMSLGPANLQATTIYATTIYIGANTLITGDVELSPYDNNLMIDTQVWVHIDGSYTQEGGWISIANEESEAETPKMKVTEELILKEVNIYVYAFYEVKKRDKLVLAQGEYINATFEEVTMVDLLPPNTAYFSKLHWEVVGAIEHDEIVIVAEEETYFRENYPWILLMGGLAIVLAVMVWRLYRYVPHQKLGDPHKVIASYFKKAKFSKLGVGAWCCLVCWGIFLIPMFIEVAVVTLALAVFIPIGIIYGFIEHKFVFVWAFIVLFGQVGGILDLFADTMLLCKYFMSNFSDYSPEELSEDGPEKTFFTIRSSITTVGALFSLILVMALRSSVGKIMDKTTGTHFWSEKPKLRKNCCERFLQSCARCCFFIWIPMYIVLACALWKVLLIAVRLLLLGQIAKSLWKYHKLEERVQRLVTWIECFFYFDMMWSGIPLGVLTVYELIAKEGGPVFNSSTVFEMTKLCALSTELISASFLFYFTVCGLSNKVPCLQHHHDHHESHDSHHIQEHDHLLDEKVGLHDDIN